MVHSKMVAFIAEEITKIILQKQPDLFIGFRQLKKETILKNKESILEYISNAGLLHDVGKIENIEIIAQYGRSLFEEEFSLIKLHPKYGYQLLNHVSSTKEYAPIALFHHLYYNRTQGYPQSDVPFPQELAIAIDIISIADSMDAATDNIGRCYSHTISVNDVIEEIVGDPERYNPNIAKLLCQNDVRTTLSESITAKRIEIYLEVYRQNSKREDS